MSIKLTVFALISAVLFTHQAHSACSATACSGLVKRVVASTTIQVQFDGFALAAGAPNCTSVNSTYLTLSVDPEARKEQYAMVLAAFLSGSQVTLRIREGSPNCEVMYTNIFNP